MGQKSDTRPLKLQSPVSSPHFPTGSRLGPPRSPVLGFVSPSNSGFMGSRAPGCSWTGSEGGFVLCEVGAGIHAAVMGEGEEVQVC